MVYHYGLRPTARLKSGGPSLGRSPGAHKQRRPANQDQIQIFGEIGSTQFLERGTHALLFFLFFWSRTRLLERCFQNILALRHDPSDRAQLPACRRTVRGSDTAGLSLPVSGTSRGRSDVPARGERSRQGVDARALHRGLTALNAASIAAGTPVASITQSKPSGSSSSTLSILVCVL